MFWQLHLHVILVMRGLLIESQWDALLKSLALLTKAYVVFVNRVGFEDGLGFWGGSR